MSISTSFPGHNTRHTWEFSEDGWTDRWKSDGLFAEIGKIPLKDPAIPKNPATQAARLMGERDKINLNRADVWTTGNTLSEPLSETYPKSPNVSEVNQKE